jgi:SulP family sulfate permease
MGAIAGIYGAIALGIFAAWFGGTNTQISGPIKVEIAVKASKATRALGISLVTRGKR